MSNADDVTIGVPPATTQADALAPRVVGATGAYVGFAVVREETTAAPEPGYHPAQEAWPQVATTVVQAQPLPTPEPPLAGGVADASLLLAVVHFLARGRVVVWLMDQAGNVRDWYDGQRL